MRLLKQLRYGIFFLIVTGAIVFGIYFLFRPKATCFDAILNQQETDIDCGGGCLPCALKQAQPILIRQVQVFVNNNDTITVYGELHNPNVKVGVRRARYSITLLDGVGKSLRTITRETFIYPDKKRTTVEPNIAVNSREVREAKISIDDYEWVLADAFGSISEAQLAISDTAFQKKGSDLIVAGMLKNNNPFPVINVAVKAVVFAAPDVALNASATVVSEIAAYGQKNFTITIPIVAADAKRLDLKLTKIILEIPR